MIPILGLEAAVAGRLAGLPPWAAVLGTVAASLLVAKLIEVAGRSAVHRLVRGTESPVDDVVLEEAHAPLYVSVVLVGLYAATLPLGLGPGIAGPLRAGVLSVVTVLWAVALLRVGRRVSEAVTADERFDRTVVPIFQNVWSAVLLGGTVFLLLALWRVDVTPLLASAGIIGIVVGFAARDTIANFFGSIALYVDGTYAVGDVIVLDSGERGRVEDVSIRSTVIRTRDDVLVTVPNAVLNAARITNESAPRRRRRIRVPVGVAYGSDPDAVEAALLAAADAEALVLDRPAPRVRFRSFGDSALRFELLCWINEPIARGRAVHRLNRAVYDAFEQRGIDIPFPQREVTVRPAGTAPGPEGPDGERAD